MKRMIDKLLINEILRHAPHRNEREAEKIKNKNKSEE